MAFLASLMDDLALDEAVAVSRKIEPKLRRDFLKELPLELALHCMSFVRLRFAMRAELINRSVMLALSAEQLKFPDTGINYSPTNRLGKRFMIGM